jgi:hypothetical protein
MHLICLGVMRKLLFLWLNGPLQNRLPSKKVTLLSNYFISISGRLPDEFARKPRSVKDLRRFKATEFRQIVLYTGVCAFRDILPQKLYRHFLLLHTATLILLSKNAQNQQWNNIAKICLQKFVSSMAKIYGKSSIYNIHSLLHIADDALRFGPLDTVSAFPFENFLFMIKKMVRGQKFHIEQIIKRVYERENIVLQTNEFMQLKIFKNKAGQIKKCVLPSFSVSNKEGNNFFMTCTGSLVLINSIIEINGTITVVCSKFKKLEEVKYYPLSSSQLGIFKSCLRFCEPETVKLTDLIHKYIVLPVNCNNSKTVYCIPML